MSEFYNGNILDNPRLHVNQVTKSMNERIKELMVKSGAYDHYEINEGVNGDELPMVKFAELIVQQCCEVFKKNWTMAGHEHPISKIKEHFGVEE